MNLFDRHTAIKQLCDAHHRLFSHAVHQKIGSGIHQDTSSDTVLPVVIVRHAAQRGLKATDENRHVAIGLSNAIAIDNDRTVGTVSHFPTGRIIVIAALFTRHGIVCHHRIDVSRADQKAQSRAAVLPEGICAFIIRLRKHGDPKARILQHPRDDRRAEGGVIYVGVAADVDEIGSIPAKRLHVGATDRQKAVKRSGSGHPRYFRSTSTIS